VKPSTFAELAGFACACVASFLAWGVTPGLGVTAACLLLIGYATEDRQAGLAVARILAPAQRRAAQVKLKRRNRRFRRNAERRERRGRERQRRWMERKPAEVLVRVKAD
jgi:hypothetical protein